MVSISKKLQFQTALLVVVAGVTLAGCTSQTKSTTPTTGTSGTSGAGAQTDTGMVKADKKVGDTTLTGTVTKAGNQYLLTIPGKPSKGIDSYKVKLDQYVGQSVTVTGQYSGDTLFVSKIN